MNNRIDKKGLVFDVVVFVERAWYQENRKSKIYAIISVILNMGLFLSTLLIGILTPMAFAKSEIFLGTTIPTWFLYIGLVVSSVSSLVSGLLNFFVVNERKTKARKNRWMIKAEIIAFANLSKPKQKLHMERYSLYHRVAKILDLNTKEVVNA